MFIFDVLSDFIHTHDWSINLLIGGMVGAAFSILFTSVFQDRLDEITARLVTRLKLKRTGLSGVWLSEYVYYSDSNIPGLHAASHYVIIYQIRKNVIVRSLKHPIGSTLVVKLTLDGNVLTGWWNEKTSKDTVYSGAIHLVVTPNKSKIYGGWLGFDNHHNVQTGPWNFTFLDAGTSWFTQRRYSNKTPPINLDALNPPFPVHQYALRQPSDRK